MHRMVRLAACCGAVTLFAALLPLAASAHEHREVVNDQYEITIGFIDEPAFVGEKNGLSLRVAKHDLTATPDADGEYPATPVEGLDQTLQAEVIFGDQTMSLPLSPAFGQPGLYQSYFFPMAEGDYTYHISGQIEGNAIDETFTSSPEGFDSVQAREPLEFPKQSASTGNAAAATIGTTDLTGTGGGFGPGGLVAGGLVALALTGFWLAKRRSAPVPARA